MNFDEYLRAFLDRNRISAAKFSAITSIPHITIKRWLNGSTQKPRNLDSHSEYLIYEGLRAYHILHEEILDLLSQFGRSPFKFDRISRIKLSDDGRIWRGDKEIEGWENLPTLQRNLLEYLYQNKGKLCRMPDIIKFVWKDSISYPGDGALRNLAKRLGNFIEPDPSNPIYIRKARGGHYRLDNASEITGTEKREGEVNYRLQYLT